MTSVIFTIFTQPPQFDLPVVLLNITRDCAIIHPWGNNYMPACAFILFLYLFMADGPQRARLPIPLTAKPVVTKDFPISSRFSPYNFLSRWKFSALTTRQQMAECLRTHVLTRSATDARIKILI